MHYELSHEQEQVLVRSARVVEAGPGSGKTRALVARYIESATDSDRGIAFLSFTNAAIEEVRRRTSSASHLLRAPHFVGTIDSFLHRFLVTPAVARFVRKPILYTACWSDLPFDVGDVRITGFPGVGIKLDHFHVDQDGDVHLNESSMSRVEAHYLDKVTEGGARAELMKSAGSRIGGLVRAGVYDAASARTKAFELITGANGDRVLRRLARRFEEVLLDEAQDCDAAELAVIERLGSFARTLVVADPDQAVYEFRGGKSHLFNEYRDAQDPGHCVELSTNFRSTAAICRLVNSLRAAGRAPIRASEEGDCAPIFVLSGIPDEQREKFLGLLAEYRIAPSEAIVLAHKRTDAQALAGRSSVEDVPRRGGDRLVSWCATLKDPSAGPADRKNAITQIETLLLSLIGWPRNLERSSRTTQLQAIGKDKEWLRRGAAALFKELQSVARRDQFAPKARSLIDAFLADLPIQHVALSGRLQKPSESVWDMCATPSAETNSLVSDTIHGAKGMEFPAVALALPRTLRRQNGRDVIDDWAVGRNTEARRVLYVGASRAGRLLAIGAGRHSERLGALLEGQGVPMKRL